MEWKRQKKAHQKARRETIALRRSGMSPLPSVGRGRSEFQQRDRSGGRLQEPSEIGDCASRERLAVRRETRGRRITKRARKRKGETKQGRRPELQSEEEEAARAKGTMVRSQKKLGTAHCPRRYEGEP